MTNRETAAIERFKSQNITKAATLETWIANAERLGATELLEVVLAAYRKVPRKVRSTKFAHYTKNMITTYDSETTNDEATEHLEVAFAELPEIIKQSSETNAGVSLGFQGDKVFNKYISISKRLKTDTIALHVVRYVEDGELTVLLTPGVDTFRYDEEQIIKEFPFSAFDEAVEEFTTRVAVLMK